MAEAVLFNTVESLLKNLGSRALDEIASTWGFKTDLVKLNNTMNTIKDVMLDAEERQSESHAVRGWLHSLKTVLYAADDLFDEFATMASQRELLDFFSGSKPTVFAANLTGKIKKIREELDDIVKDGSQFAFVLRPHEEGRTNGQTHSLANVNEIIGRDDREAIIDILMASCAAEEQPLSIISVVPIVGIGGIGKTTLAQLVYNDERIMEHFELKLWICVSKVFDLKEIVKKILMSATNEEPTISGMGMLQGSLRQIIAEKKYLLVLDDVWNEKPDEWLNLRAILKVGGEGSKILVTTRSRNVADVMGTVPPYDLNGLSKEKSWALFEKMAFEAGESQKKPHLVKLGEEIVRKCGGVPLALRTLGTLLLGNEEWKWIAIAGTSFAEFPDKQTNVMAILKLSYHHLFSPLKNCFAYCALFPKDYTFEKETMVDLWMAEGFVVPSCETQSLQQLGEEYLTLLLQRCFFQDITRDKWGNISSFKMHNLMHDLALDVSGADCKVVKLQDANLSNRIRHLSFDHQLTNTWKISSCMLTSKQLRTFVLPQQVRDRSDFNSSVLEQLISSFRCLRVLDLRNLGFRIIPNSIGKLIHLRYLNLSKNPIENLPNSITKLQNLLTLILKHCHNLEALPMHTRKLTNLRTLDVQNCYDLTHMPPGLGELTSLHKLPVFIAMGKSAPKFMWNPATAQLRDLKTLNNLSGSLHIKISPGLDDLASEPKEAILIGKHALTLLHIEINRTTVPSYDEGSDSKQDEAILETLDDEGSDSKQDEAILETLEPPQNLKSLKIYSCKGKRLPSWAMGYSLCTTLPNLVVIRLVHGNWQQLPCFSQLPLLKYLTLSCLPNVEYIEKSPLHDVESPPPPSTRTFFPSLQELIVEYMSNLKGWWEETKVVDCSDEEKLSQPLSPSFSGVIKLHIDTLTNLASFPVCPNLEEFKMRIVNKELRVLKKVTNYGGSGDIWSSKLKILHIDDVQVLMSMPVECLGSLTLLNVRDDPMFKNTSELEKVFKHLSSLTSLCISGCDNLTSLSLGMEHLVSLETLTIYWNSELDVSDMPWKALKSLRDLKLATLDKLEVSDMPWKDLKSLRELDLATLCKLERLPSGLRHLTNLRELTLFDNCNLEEVPEWIGCLSSLESLDIELCHNLRSLPKEMRKLTNLNQLTISYCNALTERCRGPNGSDWPYIRHIPFLSVYA